MCLGLQWEPLSPLVHVVDPEQQLDEPLSDLHLREPAPQGPQLLQFTVQVTVLQVRQREKERGGGRRREEEGGGGRRRQEEGGGRRRGGKRRR